MHREFLTHFSISNSAEVEPFHAHVFLRRKLCFGGRVAAADPSQYFKETGWRWSLHDGWSFLGCGCSGTRSTSYQGFMLHCSTTGPQRRTTITYKKRNKLKSNYSMMESCGCLCSNSDKITFLTFVRILIQHSLSYLLIFHYSVHLSIKLDCIHSAVFS